MGEGARGYRVAVIGGDRREAVAARELAEAGASVRCVGLPGATGLIRAGGQRQAIRGVHAVVYPVRGIDDRGRISTAPGAAEMAFERDSLGGAEPGAVVIIGKAGTGVREAAAGSGLRLVELDSDDEFCLLNAVPTAEGAIAAAVTAMPTTLHGSRAVVTGYGRCGRQLAIRLRSLGCRVLISARSGSALASAYADGLEVAPLVQLSAVSAAADVIFNTIPAVIFDASVVAGLHDEVFLFELASPPGGFDHDAVFSRGLEVTALPGLPGRTAPLTAGRYLAQAIMGILGRYIPTPAG